MAEMYIYSEWLSGGILRSFWKNCEKLEEIMIVGNLSHLQRPDARRLLSEILSLQQEMPRKIRSLTNWFPDVTGSSGLLEVWQGSLRRIDPCWGWMWKDL